MGDLRNLVNKAYSGDKDAMFSVIELFDPMLKKLERKSRYCIEKSDLSLQILIVIKFLDPIKLNHFESDGQIFNYIRCGIKNKYIQLLRYYFKINEYEIYSSFESSFFLSAKTENIYENAYLEELLSHLTNLQKYIIVQRFFYENTDLEISHQLNISRQSVNRIKNRALKKLKGYV